MRLIDADKLHYSRIRIAHSDGTIGGYNAVVMSAEIKDAPTVDAVPVVRCKDCVYSQGHFTNTPVKCCCGYGTHGEDFYCADGERRKE